MLRIMPQEKIREAIVALKRAEPERYSITISIILTDGEVLCGTLPPYPRPVIEPPPLDTLELYNEEKSISIFVPFGKIAGIAPLPYRQEREPLPRHRYLYSESPADRVIFDETLRKASVRGFEVRRHPPGVCFLEAREPVCYGEIKFTAETPLYCDWNYLSNKSGGINNLGVGFGLISFSAGWSKSLWTSFNRKVTNRKVSLRKICGRSDATLSGYISFLVNKVKSSDEEEIMYKEETLHMEGVRWLGSVIAEGRVISSKQLGKTSWAIVYFREDSFMFPKSLWEKITDPITLFGEVVNFSFKTEFGDSKCFVKARAAAYICRKCRK